MIWLSAAFAACDPDALTTLVAGLPSEPDVAYVAHGLRSACDRPYAWREALEHPEDPYLDLQAAARQASHWERACPGGLLALPGGINAPSAGKRLEIYTLCEFPEELANASEFMGSTGPVVSAVMANQILHLAPINTRYALVRALLGLPKEAADLPENPDPFAGFRPNAEPKIVTLAQVKWPPGVELDMVCIAKIRVQKEGSPKSIKWVDCPQLVRGNVESAILGSWFEPAKRNHKSRPGTLTLTFRPKKEVQQLHPQPPEAPSPLEPGEAKSPEEEVDRSNSLDLE